MNLAARLDRFRLDNPYDIDTQAKRLIASEDAELIKYAVELGLIMARSRQRHDERRFMKETGTAPTRERLIVVPGRVTGAVKIKPSKRTANAMQQLILDVWRVGDQRLGDINAAGLGDAVKRETASINGHQKNTEFYSVLRESLTGTTDVVRSRWDESSIRQTIEKVYGEFRTSEAAA